VAVLGAAFQIGRSALAAYQSAIAITGQNIANVGNTNYTRQTAGWWRMYGGMTLSGVAPGMGVNLSGLQRHVTKRSRPACGSPWATGPGPRRLTVP